MITKNRCKKIVSLIISLSLLTLCLLNFSGCRLLSNEDNEDDESKEVVIDIQTQPYDNQKNNTDRCYYSLTTDRELNETEPFTPDNIEIFTAPTSCFHWYYTKFNSKPFKYVDDIILKDEDGYDVEITPIISDIFEETARLEHSFFKIKIFQENDEYFVYVELNVNWSYPCTLYYYNQEYSRLIKLYTLDNEEVTGIKIHNLDSLKKIHNLDLLKQ